MSRYRLAAEKLQCMQMHVREGLIVSPDGGLQQSFPEAATLGPSRLQMSRRLDRDPIDLGRPQLRDRSRNRRRHAEDQIERPRQRATDRPSIHQYLANERHRALGIGRSRERARLLSARDRHFAGLRVATNRGAESSSRSGSPGSAPHARTPAHPLGPKAPRGSRRRGSFRPPRALRIACSTGAPRPRRSRPANVAARLSAARFSSSFAWSIRLTEIWERIFHPAGNLALWGFAVFAVKSDTDLRRFLLSAYSEVMSWIPMP
jgi:hypothetical protein